MRSIALLIIFLCLRARADLGDPIAPKLVPAPKAKVTSDEARQFYAQFFPALEQHLKEKGWLSFVGSVATRLLDRPDPHGDETHVGSVGRSRRWGRAGSHG